MPGKHTKDQNEYKNKFIDQMSNEFTRREEQEAIKKVIASSIAVTKDIFL